MHDDDKAFLDLVAGAAMEQRLCDVQRQHWTQINPDTGKQEPWSPHVPMSGACPFPAVKWVEWRSCLCHADPRKFGVPIESLKFSMGLVVIGQMMCQPHIDYFGHELPYPFTCPGCGVTYLHPGELLLTGDDVTGQ